LTLELGLERIPAAAFAQGVEAFLALIREVSAGITGRREAIQWYIAVAEGSARVHAYAEPIEVDLPTARTVVRTIREGIGVLYTRAERPRHFSDRALEAARKLAELATQDDQTAVPIRVASDDRSTTVSKSTIVNVQTILGPHTEAVGSIEGRIQMISERRTPRFSVYDSLTDRPVRCVFSPELFEDVVNAFRDRARVIVSGLVRYRQDGAPVSIRVETIRRLRDRAGLPTFEDVRGILRDDE
jgi:hypothetical protein